MLNASYTGDSAKKTPESKAEDMPPRGASRLIVVTDSSCNQALRLVPENRCLFVMYQPIVGDESTRRAIKTRFAGIGGGLTAIADRQGEGEWHPGHRAPVYVPTEMVTGVGPYTPEARDEFREVLMLLGRLLGQEMVMGLVLPLGEVYEVWNETLVKADREVI